MNGSGMRGKRWPLWLFLVWLMAGCGSVPIVGGSDGNIGEIGEKEMESPADIYVDLAVEYMKRQQFSPALRNARQAIAKDGGNAKAHNVAGLIYDNLGELEPAERHFRRALALQPKNPYYRNGFGFHLCKRGRYGEAEEEFMAALRNPLYSSPEVAWNNAGLCAMRAGRGDRAEEYLGKALRLNPRLPGALLEMAQIQFDKGAAAIAREYLRRYHDAASPTPRSLLLGVRIARRMGDKNGAASFELKLRSGFPDSEEYRLLRGAEFR